MSRFTYSRSAARDFPDALDVLGCSSEARANSEKEVTYLIPIDRYIRHVSGTLTTSKGLQSNRWGAGMIPPILIEKHNEASNFNGFGHDSRAADQQ